MRSVRGHHSASPSDRHSSTPAAAPCYKRTHAPSTCAADGRLASTRSAGLRRMHALPLPRLALSIRAAAPLPRSSSAASLGTTRSAHSRRWARHACLQAWSAEPEEEGLPPIFPSRGTAQGCMGTAERSQIISRPASAAATARLARRCHGALVPAGWVPARHLQLRPTPRPGTKGPRPQPPSPLVAVPHASPGRWARGCGPVLGLGSRSSLAGAHLPLPQLPPSLPARGATLLSPYTHAC